MSFEEIFEQRARKHRIRKARWDRAVRDARIEMDCGNGVFHGPVVFDRAELHQHVSEMISYTICGRLMTIFMPMLMTLERIEKVVDIMTLPPVAQGPGKYAQPKHRSLPQVFKSVPVEPLKIDWTD